MRIWVDLTNSPHVLVMRPVIRALEARGARVLVTARDFAQTLGLCDRLGIAHTAIGQHRGSGLAAKGAGLASRSLALANWAKGRRLDAALGHGSNDVSVAAKLLGVPSATTFDYEWATLQHQLGCRAATRVVVPEAIPPERLAGRPGEGHRARHGAPLGVDALDQHEHPLGAAQQRQDGATGPAANHAAGSAHYVADPGSFLTTLSWLLGLHAPSYP